MGNNKRITWLDTAKGLGILMVVFFHLDNINSLVYFEKWGGWIVSFYMVFFFLLSGIFFENNKSELRCKSLLKPYIIFYIFTYVFYLGKSVIKGGDVDLISFFNPFLGKPDVVANPPLWFLLALVEMNVISSFLLKYTRPFMAWGITFALSLIAYLLGTYKISNLYYFESVLLCLPFFLGASLFREYLLRIYSCRLGVICIIASYFLFHFFSGYYNNVSLNHIGSGYPLFMIVALLASVGFLMVSPQIDKLSKISLILSFYGRNSLVVLCTHMPLMIFQPILMNVTGNPILGISLTFITVITLEIPIIWFINKYVPFVLGK